MRKNGIPILIGIIYSSAILLVSWLFLWSLSDLAGVLLPILLPKLRITEQIVLAMAQLKEVSILPPVLPGLLSGAGIGWLSGNLCHSKKQRIVLAVIGAVLLVPLVLATLWFTKINGIFLGALLNRLLTGL